MAPIKKRSTIRAKIAQKARPAPLPNSLAAAQIATSSSFDNDATTDSPSEFASFAPSKKDKRTIKHSAFVNKIEKSATKGKRKSRRSKGGEEGLRRGLEGLVDALPEIEGRNGKGGEEGGRNDDDDGWEGMSEDEVAPASTIRKAGQGQGQSQGQAGDMLDALANMVNIRPSIKKGARTLANEQADGTMKMKTLKSNRGQAKRKQKLEGREMERFARNLAEMSKGAAAAPASTSTPIASAPASAGGAGAGTGSGAQGDRWAALRGFIGQTMEKNPNFGKTA